MSAIVILAAGCRSPGFTVIGYNVQNLFDATLDGAEYPEFRPDTGWTATSYIRRLGRLARTLRAAPGRLPDALVLCEVESASVALDLLRDHLSEYRYVSAGPRTGAATQVVVVSRHRPVELRVHRAMEIDISPDGHRTGWVSRDAVEAVLPTPVGPVRLFGAHWKSQSGGEEETEPYRRLEAALLVDRIRAIGRRDGESILIVGDLNEDLYEHSQHDRRYATALLPVTEAPEPVDRPPILFTHVSEAAGWHAGTPVFLTLWPAAETLDGAGAAGREGAADLGGANAPPGTYVFRGVWERLDHAFLLPASDVRGRLEVVVHPDLLNARGHPAAFQIRTGAGYSDHLPVLVTLATPRGR